MMRVILASTAGPSEHKTQPRCSEVFALVVVMAMLLLSEARRSPALTQNPGNTQTQRATTSSESTAHDFDFLVGSWEFMADSKMPGVPPKYNGRWTAERTGDGALVEDDYKIFDNDGRRVYLGTTLRAFDAKAKHWTTAFVEPPAAQWSLGTAWRKGDEILEAPREDSKGSRARFYDIGPDHFSWSTDRSNDGGKTWINDFVRVQARRVPTVAAAAPVVRNTSYTTKAGERVLRIETVVPMSVERVWNAWTTQDGLKEWIAPVVAIDLRTGGAILTNYDKKATIGDEGTIKLPIINYIEKQLITLKVKLNKNFPNRVREEDHNLQEVVQILDMGDGNTKIVSSMVGWRTGKEWDDTYNFFARGNEWTYQQLAKYLALRSN